MLVKVVIFEAFQDAVNVLLVFKDHHGPHGPTYGGLGLTYQTYQYSNALSNLCGLQLVIIIFFNF